MPRAQGVSGWTALYQLVRDGGTGPTAPLAGGGTRNIFAADRWYWDGEIPPTGAPRGYFLQGADDEDPSGFLLQPGTRATYRLHAWGDSPLDARRMAEWLWERVHGNRLPLDGMLAWDATARIVTGWDATARMVTGGADRQLRAFQRIVEVTLEAVEV